MERPTTKEILGKKLDPKDLNIYDKVHETQGGYMRDVNREWGLNMIQ